MTSTPTMNATMTERFNVAGALLVKLFGRPTARPSRSAAGPRGSATSASCRPCTAAPSSPRSRWSPRWPPRWSTARRLRSPFTGSLSAGDVVALALLLSRLYGPLTALSNVRVDVMTALVSFDRVFEVLDLQPMIAGAPDAVPVPAGDAVDRVRPRVVPLSRGRRGLARLAGGGRRCPSTAARSTCCTTSRSASSPASMVALVGPSGAGKTTIANLVPRLYDVTGGAVRVDGVDVRDATLRLAARRDRRRHARTPTCSTTRIRANLLYARPEADRGRALGGAARARRSPTWSQSCPTGLDTVVGERGYRLSGGEKQRLAIARVLLKEPGIVILDEATAHLDSESEVAVQQALDTALAGRTSLVIAHRLSTIRSADQILVVDERPHRRARHARGAARTRRPLRRPLPHPVRRRRASNGRGRLTTTVTPVPVLEKETA